MGLKDGKIATDLHAKPTDRHQYLHFSSVHSNYTKLSVVFTQTLRISRYVLTRVTLSRTKREYPEKPIDSEMRKIKFKIRESNRKN